MMAPVLSLVRAWNRAAALLYIVAGATAVKMIRLHQGLQPAREALSESDAGALETAFGCVKKDRQRQALSQLAAGLVQGFRARISSIQGTARPRDGPRLHEERREQFVRTIQRQSRLLDRTRADMREFTEPRNPRPIAS